MNEVPNAFLPELPALSQEIRAAKLPAWDLADLELRNCPVCDSLDSKQVAIRPDRLIVSECNKCSMVYLAAIPNANQLADFYRDYHSFKGFSYGSALARLRDRFSNDPHLSILEATGGLSGETLCEIGCSYGRFLDRCKSNGALVHGVELNDDALQSLHRRGFKASAEFPDGIQFDVVCAFQLFEHLASPNQLMAQISRSMRPDGRLLLSMPNGGEIGVVGPTWLGFRVDLEHLNYFSVRTIANLMYRHGLYLEHYWTYGQPGISRKHSGIGSRLLNRVRKWTTRSNAPTFSEGNFVLSVLARRYA
jgi:2-polyprenyl-3-methyl-5-hydroxy-6-metoxy-1,4-benzoquinol methylase